MRVRYAAVSHFSRFARMPLTCSRRSERHLPVRLIDIVNRLPQPEPWAEGEKIPWNDPDFSERMLGEHLSQEHDAASRRGAVIDAHVAWIHNAILNGTPAKILDLCCGPGLYTSRLARLGHECVGIDFSPASIRYARESAAREGAACTYHLGDVRSADYGDGYQLAMLIFGELNVFRPEDASLILGRARQALVDGAKLVLEAHTYAAVEAKGRGARTWRSSHGGLFSSKPHLLLEEPFWDEARHVATHRYFVIDAKTAQVTRYASSMQAYTEQAYRELLASSGFEVTSIHGSLSHDAVDGDGEFLVLVCVAA